MNQHGPHPTAETAVSPGHGFNGGTIYYPTGTSQGPWGAVAIVPGYTALFADEGAWMGPWLASFGFVVIGIETNSRDDRDVARGTQLLAGLDYLTERSPVRDRVDPARQAVIGHSMGGGGAINAALRRPSLNAAVALVPYSPSQDLATLQVPMMIIGGLDDPTVTPAYLDCLYATMPAATPSRYVQLPDADHGFFTRANDPQMRILIPWLKVFVDENPGYTHLIPESSARSANTASPSRSSMGTVRHW